MNEGKQQKRNVQVSPFSIVSKPQKQNSCLKIIDEEQKIILTNNSYLSPKSRIIDTSSSTVRNYSNQRTPEAIEALLQSYMSKRQNQSQEKVKQRQDTTFDKQQIYMQKEGYESRDISNLYEGTNNNSKNCKNEYSDQKLSACIGNDEDRDDITHKILCISIANQGESTQNMSSWNEEMNVHQKISVRENEERELDHEANIRSLEEVCRKQKYIIECMVQEQANLKQQIKDVQYDFDSTSLQLENKIRVIECMRIERVSEIEEMEQVHLEELKNAIKLAKQEESKGQQQQDLQENSKLIDIILGRIQEISDKNSARDSKSQKEIQHQQLIISELNLKLQNLEQLIQQKDSIWEQQIKNEKERVKQLFQESQLLIHKKQSEEKEILKANYEIQIASQFEQIQILKKRNKEIIRELQEQVKEKEFFQKQEKALIQEQVLIKQELKQQNEQITQFQQQANQFSQITRSNRLLKQSLKKLIAKKKSVIEQNTLAVIENKHIILNLNQKMGEEQITNFQRKANQKKDETPQLNSTLIQNLIRVSRSLKEDAEKLHLSLASCQQDLKVSKLKLTLLSDLLEAQRSLSTALSGFSPPSIQNDDTLENKQSTPEQQSPTDRRKHNNYFDQTLQNSTPLLHSYQGSKCEQSSLKCNCPSLQAEKELLQVQVKELTKENQRNPHPNNLQVVEEEAEEQATNVKIQQEIQKADNLEKSNNNFETDI